MSNLLKQCFVVNSGGGMRIINSNDRINERLKEIAIGAHVPEEQSLEFPQENANENADDAEFNSGIEAPKIDVEAIRREAIEAAQKEADEIVAKAKVDAMQQMKDAQTQAQILFSEQKQLGYQEGFQQAQEELRQKEASLEADYQAKEQERSQNYQKKMDEMEADLVDAIIQVFDKVFSIQFEDKRPILLALVNNTLLDVEVGNKVRIRANEQDLAMLKEHQEQFQESIGQEVSIEFVHDNKLSEGQCQIETSYGVFDCGVDTEMSNLIKDIRSLL